MNALNLEQLARSFQAWDLSGVIDDSARVLKVLAVAGVKEHFRRSQAPDGTPWRALSHARVGGGDKPLLDKGTLQASVTAEVTGKQLILMASHPAAGVHQFGATIRPKNGRFLAIPLTPEAKRVGSPRQNHFPRPLFVYAAQEGRKLFLAESVEGELTIQYRLVGSVTIPPRPYLGFSATTVDKITRVIADRAEAMAVAVCQGAAASRSALRGNWSDYTSG